MSTDDLEKGYWPVPLHLAFIKHIGLKFFGHYFIANILILGITDAVYAFTKLINPIVWYLRAHCVKYASYIDDIFNAHQPQDRALKNHTFLLFTLEKCGWLTS